MKYWRRRFQDWYMSEDSKPKRRNKSLVQKMMRSDIKKNTKDEIRSYEQDEAADAQRGGASSGVSSTTEVGKSTSKKESEGT